MNILVIGLPFFGKAFRSMGHTVVNANSSYSDDLVLNHPQSWQSINKKLRSGGFEADFVLYVDNGNLPLLIDPHNIPVPSIYYSIDTYCNPWHIPYAHAFDMVLAAQKDFLPFFLNDGQNGKWLPLFCMEALCEMETPERDIPVSFVGTLGHKNNPRREPFLRKFAEYQPLTILSGNYVPIFSRSKIVLNQTAFGEINFRCFEVMGLGAALLMEKCGNGLDELFTPGENILPTYTRNDAAQAARIAEIFLGRPAALEEIAKNGRDLVRKEHTEAVRGRQILSIAEPLFSENAAARRISELQKYRRFTGTAFGMLASELEGDEWQPFKKLYCRILEENYRDFQ